MPAASDPSAALGVPAVGEHRRSLLSPGFVLVTAATLFYFIALGALLPTLPVYVEDELGGGSVAVGVTVGVFAVSAALLRPLAGRLGDTRGRRILVIGGSLVMGVSVLAYTLVDSIAALVALRLLTGAGEAAMWVGAATAIQDMAPDDRRGEAASYFSVALYAGLAFGPLVGEGLRDSAGFHAVWIFAGCCGLVACALGFGTPRDVRREPQPFRLLHPAALGPGAILLLGMLPFIGFATFIALYGPTVGFADVAPLLLVYGVLVLVIRVVGAKLPDQLGWTRASSTALSVLAVGGLLLGLWSGTAGVWLAVVALAIGMSLLFPALFSATVAAVPESERGQAVGTFSLSFDLASGLGPAVLGVVVALADYRAAFVVAGIGAAAGLALVGPVARRAAASARSTG
ncbi:MAG TPA: MFS transporter [Microthrixaceae bacterium]|nr:MFS transporter [Microthrixaceae bacterium]HMV73467.1 MFS transporter [Microthrixaceae bacterium]HMX07190.1 MFS transporter [Microthrixaceae bacterium]HMX66997.1 MFS transporter [Microthrixaceae bacterium]HMY87888.1 MFS transporter [Microthrixaceae bacterium]